MDVSQFAAQPAWWSQYVPSGELDVKEDIRPAASNIAKAEGTDAGWGDDGFGFDDFVDIINPLQHLPFLSTLYREVTGDEISPAARMAGSSLYGGPVGLIAGLSNVFAEAEGGDDIGSTIIASLTGRAGAAAEAGSLPSAATTIAETHKNAAVHPTATSGVPETLPSPQAVAAYAEASALGLPGRGAGPVNWTEGVISQQKSADPSLQSVPGRGLDALIRDSQAKVATRKRGPTLPSLVQPGLTGRTAPQPEAGATTALAMPAGRAGLADWMMKALDKYESMKAPGQETS